MPKDVNTMLKECKEHKYFRGEACPVCGSAGKFLMNDNELDHVGRIMAGVLRHFPEKFGLEMDEKGWVGLDKFIGAIQARRRELHWIRQHHIRAIIETDDKGRYQCENDALRATYGHTLNVLLDLPTDNTPPELFYPTTPEEVEIILETGLKPVDRKKVHLSRTYENAFDAGAHRAKNPVIIKIDAGQATKDGITIMQAGKTVFLAAEIPAKYLSVEKRAAPEEVGTAADGAAEAGIENRAEDGGSAAKTGTEGNRPDDGGDKEADADEEAGEK